MVEFSRRTKAWRELVEAVDSFVYEAEELDDPVSNAANSVPEHRALVEANLDKEGRVDFTKDRVGGAQAYWIRMEILAEALVEVGQKRLKRLPAERRRDIAQTRREERAG